jgi:hypothetical protein
MNNIGGLLKLYYIDADDYVDAEEGTDGIYDLMLATGSAPIEISFTEDTGRISETEQDTDHGIQYNYEISCRIPKLQEDNRELLGDLRRKKLLILAQDGNENWWLTGRPGVYFKIDISKDTGANTQDRNNQELKISASLAEGSVFVNPLS